MKSTRSSFALLFSALGAALLFANCTVKSVDDTADDACTPKESHACTCTNGDKGAQLCNSKGTGYGACDCDGSNTTENTGGSSTTTNNSEGGAGNETSTGGTSAAGTSQGGTTYDEGGAAAVDGGAGAGGEGPVIDPATDCDNCIGMQCMAEYEACAGNELCPDQYAAVLDCITTARGDGLVKRDVVRGCGVSLGMNATPSTPSDFVWAPQEMDPTTTSLLNCMASGDANDFDWANSEANFSPTIAPWKAGTCAKLSCTSGI